MNERYEDAVRKWAARRLNALPPVIDWHTKEPKPPVRADDIERVDITGNAGWGGTDVTAGDPGEFSVQAVFHDHSTRDIIDFTRCPDGSRGMYSGQCWDFATLLHEILDEGAS